MATGRSRSSNPPRLPEAPTAEKVELLPQTTIQPESAPTVDLTCPPSLDHAELESSGIWGHSGVDVPEFNIGDIGGFVANCTARLALYSGSPP